MTEKIKYICHSQQKNTGISLLGDGQYKNAAKAFLEVPFETVEGHKEVCVWCVCVCVCVCVLCVVWEGQKERKDQICLMFPPLSCSVLSQLMSARDIAIYGGICALATFDRESLKKKVIDYA